MTCKQARQLLAAYRREDLSPGEDAELQAHLLECAECRAHAAEFRHIGEAVQALPKLAPPPDFYARVMAAVQAETQQTAARAPAAAPKKPEKVVIPGLTDVAYLPSVRRAVMQRRARVTPLRSQLSPAGVFALRYSAGLAALFMIFALGVSAGLFFFLLPGPTPTGDCLLTHTCPGPFTSIYSPDPAYPLVADATASPDGQHIIYAAHNISGSWMLEELNIQSGKSTALLPAPVSGPLKLEGWAQSWFLWVQGDPSAGKSWQLDATELSPALPGAASTLRLLQGHSVGPDGAVTALHGVSTLGSTVLLAEELANGHGQLVSLNLADQADTARPVLAVTEQPGHLITDPVATIDPITGGMMEYWVDQWQDADGTLHGNIWRLTPGSVAQAVTMNTISFAPRIVEGKLFWLEEAPAQNGSTASGQAASTPTASPTSSTTPGSGNGTDSQITGIIWSENLDGRPNLDLGPKTALAGTDAPVSAPQAGATFVVWQTKRGDYYLYDVSDGHQQSLNESVTNPLILSVSPTAVLWVTNDSPSSSLAAPIKTAINLMDWPQ